MTTNDVNEMTWVDHFGRWISHTHLGNLVFVDIKREFGSAEKLDDFLARYFYAPQVTTMNPTPGSRGRTEIRDFQHLMETDAQRFRDAADTSFEIATMVIEAHLGDEIMDGSSYSIFVLFEMCFSDSKPVEALFSWYRTGQGYDLNRIGELINIGVDLEHLQGALTNDIDTSLLRSMTDGEAI
jgi:hypothetical protein